MKAWILNGINDLKYSEIETPEIRSGWCLVKVMAAGICGSDVPRIFETGAHRHPLVPGHEFSGIVAKGTNKWVGKRVGVFPLIPCYECGPCREKKYEMCKNYNYMGSRCDGGFAEYTLVPEKNLIELPENISFEQAAMLEPSAVAVHAIRKVNPQKNSKAVVIGLGTIGLMVAMFLSDIGVSVHAVGNKEYQYKKLKLLGIENIELDRGEADCVFECVGKNESIQEAIDFVKPEGTVVIVGNPATDISLKKEIYWKILRSQLSIKGTWNSSFTRSEDDDWHYVLKKVSEGKIQPERLISHRYKLGELERGLDIMRCKSENYTKIMIT